MSSASLSATAIPLGDAWALRAPRRRTRLLRLGLGAALIAVAVSAFFVSRGQRLSPTPLLPPGSSGIIVLDLSISVENGTLDRMYTGLSQLAATRDRFGLVLFSSRAYEALPPNTPASELRPFARFFLQETHQPGSASAAAGTGAPQGPVFAGGGQAPAQNVGQLGAYPANPWSCCFSFGTEISDGLSLARSLLLDAKASQRSVWLMSDLADDPADRAVVSTVARSYAQSRIALHVIGLNPSPADQKFFEGLLGSRGSIIDAKPAAEVRLATRHVFPIALVVVGVVLSLLLALNELWNNPLRWGLPALGGVGS